MKALKIVLFVVIFSALWISCSSTKNGENGESFVRVIHSVENQRVDILIGDRPFTSYIYTDTIPDLKKTVLYPIYSAKGSLITRGYPLDPRPGERIDHPHHIGLWLNYGDINGIDFWGHSNATPEEQSHRMGTIRHQQIKEVKSGEDSGSLEVTMNWLNSENQPMLKEETRFLFAGGEEWRRIDRITTLTALDKKMIFNDTKEGMMAIRVHRALEHPSDKPVVLSDEHGNQTEVAKLDNSGVTGHYLNSEGTEGLDVWGKRAKWVELSGTIEDEKVSVIIFDHPENVGHPTYWHARGYGLFAANPLGQETFSEGEESLNLTLNPGQSVTFKYRMVIQTGQIDPPAINDLYDDYTKE
ncbi:MAG: PmoA family protein [Bacteroidales bacterium]|nr:PmoA family protein [Bacteroidales bacterium]